MKRSFSFTENPVLFILKLLPQLIPGVEKVVAVYWSEPEQNLLSTILRNEKGEYVPEEFEVSDAKSVLKRFRSENAHYTWLRNEDLPFDIKSKEKIQLNIFNELNNNILLLRIKNLSDSQNDLFFLYFNQNLSNFGTVNPNKMISTENKTIIAHLIRNSILSHLSILENDKELFATLIENTRSIINETRQVKKKVAELQKSKKSSIIHLCNSYLREISRDCFHSYHLSESALEKISEFDGNVENLKAILEKAAKFADTMVPDRSESSVMISDFHLYFEIEKQLEPEREAALENRSEVPVKYLKTLILLDRMEQAALQLKSQNRVLTSSNLGNEFPKPISPPAITDALKKHRLKILHLFREYPTRWLVIRNEFRPVQNMITGKPGPDKLTA